MLRRAFNGVKSEESVNQVLDLFAKTRNNGEFVSIVKKQKWFY
jgi:transcription termination factor Rho